VTNIIKNQRDLLPIRHWPVRTRQTLKILMIQEESLISE